MTWHRREWEPPWGTMLRAGCTWTTSGAAIARGRTGEAIRAGGSRLEPLCHVCLPKDWHAAPSALSPWTQQLSNSRGSLPCPSPSPGPPIPLTLWQAPAPPHVGVTHVTWGTSVRRNKAQLCQVPDPRGLGASQWTWGARSRWGCAQWGVGKLATLEGL